MAGGMMAGGEPEKQDGWVWVLLPGQFMVAGYADSTVDVRCVHCGQRCDGGAKAGYATPLEPLLTWAVTHQCPPARVT